jgi:hypothetical protein
MAGCSSIHGQVAKDVPPASGTAAALLETLTVAPPSSTSDYDRDLFGQRWADVDRNGCDTRNDILARDLTDKAFRLGTHDCVVIAGELADPYTAATITFAKAQADKVQIDHVVALADAWVSGADRWNPETRLRFANDPLNLLAVDGSANQSKGADSAADWLPPNQSFRCAYAARQVTVKADYDLSVTPAEHDALAEVLEGCSSQQPSR